MSLVVDASIALAWASPDEHSAVADRAMVQVSTEGGFVPEVWKLEVSNIVLINERRGRYGSEAADIMLGHLLDLPIRTMRLDMDSLKRVVEFARQYKLTTYDAAYLELAKRLALPLATLD